MEYSILGSILGFPYFGKLPYLAILETKLTWLQSRQQRDGSFCESVQSERQGP